MSEIGFTNVFTNLAKDGFIDKNDLEKLKSTSSDLSTDKTKYSEYKFSKNIVSDLNKYQESLQLKYTLSFGEIKEQLDFKLTTSYSESDKIPGANMDEALKYVYQGDNLRETDSDSSRCSVATMVNIKLRAVANQFPKKSTDEVFGMVAKKFNLTESFTYENVHQLQDKLYKLANSDDSSGISAGNSYSYNPQSGQINNIQPDGEINTLADKLGLHLQPLLGKNIHSLHDRTEMVNDFFKNNPKGSLIVSVYMDDKGNLYNMDINGDHNHSVEVYQRNKEFYMKDTGSSSNGVDNLKKLTSKQMDGFVYQNPGSVMGVTSK